MIQFGFLKTEAFHTAFSILLGIAVVSLFHSACKGKECRVEKPPPYEEVNAATYQIGSECYQFRAEIIDCPSSGVIEPFQRF